MGPNAQCNVLTKVSRNAKTKSVARNANAQEPLASEDSHKLYGIQVPTDKIPALAYSAPLYQTLRLVLLMTADWKVTFTELFTGSSGMTFVSHTIGPSKGLTGKTQAW